MTRRWAARSRPPRPQRRIDGSAGERRAERALLSPTARRTSTPMREVDHRAVGTVSLQDYRGIAARRGRGVQYHGVRASRRRQNQRTPIESQPPAVADEPRSTRSLSCRSTRTTCSARTAPRLASSIRGVPICSHAASRRPEARRLLTRAFAASVLNRMKLPSYAAAGARARRLPAAGPAGGERSVNAVSAQARDTRGSELLDVERVRRDFSDPPTHG